MENDIIFSLKPKFAKLIEEQTKNHEFRNYVPKELPNRIWFYISSPVCKLMYLVETTEPIERPNKIKTEGLGNKNFNKGEKASRFAFPIKHLHKLEKPIELEELRDKFNFTAPQSFTYLKKNPKLAEFLKAQPIKKLF